MIVDAVCLLTTYAALSVGTLIYGLRQLRRQDDDPTEENDATPNEA